MILGLIHALRHWRADDRDAESPQASFGVIDLGVLLIAAGHVIATVVVFQVEGDRRSALNLTLEWSGLFAAWRLFRSLCLERLRSTQISAAMIAIAVGLSAFGIWQHHVFYPEQSTWYRQQRTLLDQAIAQQDGPGVMKAKEIIERFRSEQIPLEGTDRILWENRLLSSSEPFATFSLANTLAGVLATALVLMAGQFSAGRGTRQRQGTWDIFILLVQVSLIAWCLILTKSRSAWAGALAGLVILAIVRSRTSAAQKILRWGIAAAIVAGAGIGAGALFGALDKEVILESPRSLQFRLFYWTGAVKMLREHPWAGAGPGNFRQLYLQHKADESSEEIRDPHNFVLEAWSAGGLAGMVGLLLFAGGVIRTLKASAFEEIRHEPLSLGGPKTRAVVPSGLLLGFALHAGWEWINGHEFSLDQSGKLLLLTGVLLISIRKDYGLPSVDGVSGLAAAMAMMVHLLAAGGFEMPAVMLFLLVCSAIGVSDAESLTDLDGHSSGAFSRGRRWRWKSVPAAGMCAGTAMVVLQFGLIPVLTSERHILEADYALRRLQNSRAAADGYRKAAESDPLGTVARQRFAELETYRLSEIEAKPNGEDQIPEDQSSSAIAGRSVFEERLSEALAACDLLISADRRNSFSLRIRAACLATGGRVLNNPEMLTEAIRVQQQVVALYPSSVQNWFDLVTLCETPLADCEITQARQAAQRTLELDAINRQWGHQDRYLAEEQLNLLHRIVKK
jgi:hypothetical protein